MVDCIKRSAQQWPTPEFERRGGIDAVGVVDYVHDLRASALDSLSRDPASASSPASAAINAMASME
jgi:hypothetical protein